MLSEQVTTTQVIGKQRWGPRMSFSKQSDALRCLHGYQSIKAWSENRIFSDLQGLKHINTLTPQAELQRDSVTQ